MAILVGDPLPILRDAVAANAKFAVVFAAGFAEVGAEGEKIQAEMEEIIDSGDLHVLGPNTNLNAFEVFRDDLPGKAITLITQSGHQGRPVFQGQEIGIRLSHWAPAGNEADMESADFIRYFSDLHSTGAIACYIEGFKNGRTLQLAADHAAQKKVPIVAVKVGRTDEGTAMAKAHTGHLTGSDAVVSSVFRQYGVHRVDGLDQLLDVSATLARTKPPTEAAIRRLKRGAGGRVCVYSISGGTGAHMADMVSAAGLELPPLTKHSQTELHTWIPPVPAGLEPGGQRWGARSVTGGGPRSSRRCSPTPTSTCCSAPSPGPSRPWATSCARTWWRPRPRPTSRSSWCGAHRWATRRPTATTLLQSAVPTFRTFTNAVMAAQAYFDHHRFVERVTRRRSPTRCCRPARPRPRPRVAGIGPRATAGQRHRTQRAGLQGVAHGVRHPGPQERVVTSAADAAKAAKRIGFPVVMKIVSADIVHKSDLGLVAVGVRDEDDARRIYKRLMATAKKAAPKASIDGVLVAQWPRASRPWSVWPRTTCSGRWSCSASVASSSRCSRTSPSGSAVHQGRRRRHAGRIGRLGHAGRRARQPAADLDALVDVLMKVQHLAVDLSADVAEFDINPLLAGPKGVVAADALVVLS